MAGLYIHIPFCTHKCRYCDFTSFSGRENDMAAYVERLCDEMRGYRGRVFQTVFIGGGTPSCLPEKLIKRLCDTLHACFVLAPGAEMTCEMNPGTVTDGFLKTIREAGFNRASMGMQAKGEKLLKTLGRTHRDHDVGRTAVLLKANGFDNFNIDLMFGIPGQTAQDVREAIQGAAALGASHISCYGLIVEENTPLARDIASGRQTLPDEEAERGMYDLAARLLKDKGYQQYEISNFAQKGRACRHNIGYWRQKPYLGVGLAAHSYVDGVRFYNTEDLSEYLRGVTVAGRETLSPSDSRFETLMLGLRMTQGVRLKDFESLHGMTLQSAFGEKMKPLIKKELLEIKGGALKLTRRGMDVQNAVLVELMD